MKHILVTGGHITPAIAVLEEAFSQGRAWRVTVAGRKYAIEGANHLSPEYVLVTEKKWKFLPLTTGRIHRDNLLKVIPSLIKIPVGFFQGLWYLIADRPDVIVSFGGYLAVPVAAAGRLLGIPIITHEQTLVPGLANKFIAHMAKRICVTFPDDAHVFDPKKTVRTGLPIRKEIFAPPKALSFSLNGRKPILYITGGSTGAVSINNLVLPLIPELTKTYAVVHQTGSESLASARKVQSLLAKEAQTAYHVSDFISASDVAYLLAKSTLVIARSGANTVTEIAASGNVALFIPLPWSGGGEQMESAKWLAAHGGALVVPQAELTSTTLLTHIQSMVANHAMYAKKAHAFASTIPTDAAKRVVSEIVTVIGKE